MATSSIYIRHRDNVDHFEGKLHTWRDCFCYIQRKVYRCDDPDEIWDFYGKIKTPTGEIIVTSGDGEVWEVL